MPVFEKKVNYYHGQTLELLKESANGAFNALREHEQEYLFPVIKKTLKNRYKQLSRGELIYQLNNKFFVKIIDCDNERFEYIAIVKAKNNDHALDVLRRSYIPVDEQRIYSDYDCTGLWFSDGAKVKKICKNRYKVSFVSRCDV